jgi:hypothetical protein
MENDILIAKLSIIVTSIYMDGLWFKLKVLKFQLNTVGVVIPDMTEKN